MFRHSPTSAEMSASNITWFFDDATTTSAQLTMTSLSSPSTLNRFRVVLNVYVVSIVCAFGITGNLVSMAVLGRDRSIRRTTGFLLQALAASDTAYLVTCLLYQTTKTVHDVTDWGSPGTRRVWPYLEPYVWPLASIAQTCTVWVVVVVTADRYVAICRPLHAPQYSTVSRARMSVIVCWVVAIVYNLPRFFERATIHRNDVSAAQSDANMTTSMPSPDVIGFSSPSVTSGSDSSVAVIGHPHVVRTPLHDHTVYIVVYRTGLFFIARFLIPFCALAFFNTRLIMAVRESSRLPGRHWGSSAAAASRSTTINATPSSDGFAETCRRPSSWQRRQHTTSSSSSSSSPGGRKERYTLTLVVVVIVFVACELPDMFLRAWLALHSCLPAVVPFPKGVLMFVNGASNLCLTLNSSVNFLVYCFVGQRFRVVLIRMVCPSTGPSVRPTDRPVRSESQSP